MGPAGRTRQSGDHGARMLRGFLSTRVWGAPLSLKQMDMLVHDKSDYVPSSLSLSIYIFKRKLKEPVNFQW